MHTKYGRTVHVWCGKICEFGVGGLNFTTQNTFLSKNSNGCCPFRHPGTLVGQNFADQIKIRTIS
eukprot:SAG22_NODE_74_length_22289_cov_65.265119_6_plen_65_part_00